MSKKTHTKDILAAALTKAGLQDMAIKAAAGYYHDYLSPLDTPSLQLDADLMKAGTPAALAIRARHRNGDFDANREESEEWARSSEGRETFAALTEAPKERLGDAPIEAAYSEQMNAVAAALDATFNSDAKGGKRSTGFVLMVFPFGDHSGRCNYISNGADRRDIIALMKEMIARFEGQPETKGRA